jgi:hypothetical protein
MVRENEIRAGELSIDAPAVLDAQLIFIGPLSSAINFPRLGNRL